MKLKTTIFLIIFLFTANFRAYADQNISNDIKKVLRVTCSLFPVYDFTRAITGDLAEIKLLLPPGVEPHEFEPSALDVKALNDSDVFIFTGNLMESWAEKISRSLTRTKIINASENINIINNDAHIWLDLSRAQEMMNNILAGLCEVSPENAQTFTDNAKVYCSKLAGLDEKFFALEKNKTLVFAGEFSAQYLMRRYGFDYISAYEGENEPSIKKLAQVMKFIRENKTRYIFSEPLNISQITRSISEETGTEILTFDTCHNVKDIDETFIEIMTGNYINLTKALND